MTPRKIEVEINNKNKQANMHLEMQKDIFI